MSRLRERTLPALFLGGLVGAVTLGIEMAAANVFAAGLGSMDVGLLGVAVGLALMTAIFAAPVFLIGFFGVGWPVWAALDRLGVASVWAAVLAGAIGVTLGAAALLALLGLPSLLVTLGFPLPGAVAGLAVWRAAYSAKPPPAQPS